MYMYTLCSSQILAQRIADAHRSWAISFLCIFAYASLCVRTNPSPVRQTCTFQESHRDFWTPEMLFQSLQGRIASLTFPPLPTTYCVRNAFYCTCLFIVLSANCSLVMQTTGTALIQLENILTLLDIT